MKKKHRPVVLCEGEDVRRKEVQRERERERERNKEGEGDRKGKGKGRDDNYDQERMKRQWYEIK